MPLSDAFHQLAKQVNNWGRWGRDDEIGTLNLVTPEVVRRAAACVRHGRTFSLAHPLSASEGIQTGSIPGRINPIRTMLSANAPATDDPDGARTSDDLVVMGLQAATHWDGLAHFTYSGRMYNGYPVDSIGVGGATRCGIHHIRTFVSRGVLLDVARATAVERLEPGYAITPDDLDAAEVLAALTVGPGDVVLVRTGHVQLLRRPRPDRRAYVGTCPGLGMATARWFHQRDVAAVAVDNLAFDVYPPEDPAVILPLHLLHLVEMGMTQGQNWMLEELAADCAADGVYEFLLDASPLPFTNALGSPVNPIAVK